MSKLNSGCRTPKWNADQANWLVDFMLENRDFATNRFPTSSSTCSREEMWETITRKLNCLGPCRGTAEWKTVWRDMKRRTLNKIRDINFDPKQTGNGKELPMLLNHVQRKVYEVLKPRDLEDSDVDPTLPNSVLLVVGEPHTPQHQQTSPSHSRLMLRRRRLKNEPRPEPVETEETESCSMPCERLENSALDAQIIAKGWGLEYGKMSAEQQLYAKKFIDEILFEGRLGNLHRYSMTINNHPDPPETFATTVNSHTFNITGS